MTGQNDQNVDSTIYNMIWRKYRNIDISICNYVMCTASNGTKSKLEGKKVMKFPDIYFSARCDTSGVSLKP